MIKQISEARLKSYKNNLKLKTNEEALKAYYWNKALCASIYPALQTLEITLRNSLDEAVKTNHLGKYANDEWWFKHIVTEVQNQKIASMSKRNKNRWVKASDNGLRRIKKSNPEQSILNVERDLENEGRSHLHPDDVLGRLMFGFWCSMLSKDFEDVTKKTLLWPNLLTRVFPNTPYKPKRHKIEETLSRIKTLRNRISHHEPVWKFYYLNSKKQPDYQKPIYGLQPSLSLLNKTYNEILEFIRWMSEPRYQSFIDAKLDLQFRKLCSSDGFFAYVNKDKVSNKLSISRYKREALKYIKNETKSDISITVITRANKTIGIIGIDEPKIFLDP